MMGPNAPHGGERKAKNEPTNILCHRCGVIYPTGAEYLKHLPLCQKASQ